MRDLERRLAVVAWELRAWRAVTLAALLGLGWQLAPAGAAPQAPAALQTTRLDIFDTAGVADMILKDDPRDGPIVFLRDRPYRSRITLDAPREGGAMLVLSDGGPRPRVMAMVEGDPKQSAFLDVISHEQRGLRKAGLTAERLELGDFEGKPYGEFPPATPRR